MTLDNKMLELIEAKIKEAIEKDYATFSRADAYAKIARQVIETHLTAREWLPMTDAPRDGTPIRLKVETIFPAKWQSGFLDGAGEDCSCWQATVEDNHPEDWHDGVCWENNADEQPSSSPSGWQLIAAPAQATAGEVSE